MSNQAGADHAPVRKLLVANRGEISIRVMRASAEMGIRTVAIYAHEDRFALHRFKADESYLVGKGAKPIAAIWTSRTSFASRWMPAPMPFIPATAFFPRIRISPKPARRPASAS